MATTVQEPYNLFAQEKRQYYDTVNQQPQQPIVPGNVQGATVQDFANGKAAANSQAGVVNQPVTTPVTPTTPVNTTATNGGKTMGIRSGEWDNEPMKRGGYTQPITSMDDLARAMNYTTPKEEERLRKASVANQRILAVADAMRHIGNIYNTVRYAPAQQFNSPVLEEQSRYERGKAMRDKANQIYLSYQQQKAAQDAKQKQWEAEQKQKADQWNATYKYNAARDAAKLAENARQYDAGLAYRKENDEANRKQRGEHYAEQERQGRQRIGISAQNSKNAQAYREWRMKNGGGSGGKKNMNTIYSRRGYLTKEGATDADMKRIYDNLYEWGKKRGSRGKDGKLHPHIDEGGILSGIAPNLYGGKQISDVAKREAVDKMIMEHDDAAVELAKKYGFTWHEGTPSEVGASGNWDDYLEEDDDWNDYLAD